MCCVVAYEEGRLNFRNEPDDKEGDVRDDDATLWKINDKLKSWKGRCRHKYICSWCHMS